MSAERPIRYGILCKGTTLPSWQAQAVRHLLETPGAELVVIATPREQLRERADGKGFRGQLVSRCLDLLTSKAMDLVDLSEDLSRFSAVEFSTTSDGRPDSSVCAPMAPDLLVSLLGDERTEGSERTGIPIWSFAFGSQRLRSNGAPTLQTAVTSDRSMEVRLVDSGKGSFGLQLPLRDREDGPTLDLLLFGASWLPAAVVSALRSGRSKDIDKDLIKTAQATEKEASVGSLIWMLLDLKFRRMSRSTDRERKVPEWNVGILHQPIASLLEERSSMNVRWLPSPSPGNLRMEPFGYTAADGQLNVLYRKTHRAHEFDEIARLRPKGDSVLKRSRTMLTTAAHLHYPFIVERPDGAYVLISYPHQDRTELFKVAETNDGFDHIKTLINKSLINPTSTFYNGKWWLFGTDPDAPDHVLLAYWSDEFEGPYRSHAHNPLRISDKSVRPAGTFFTHNNRLWRPAVATDTEGSSAVTLNEVTELSPNTFSEVIGKRVEGFPGTVYAKGVRTLCAMGDITVIDGLRGAAPEIPKKRSGRSSRKKRKEE